MNTNIVSQLEQSHLIVIQVVDDLPEEDWDIPQVCGAWSVKDIIGHITSYEHLLVDALNTVLGIEPTSNLLKFFNQHSDFNQHEIEARQYQTAQQIMDEYNETQLQSTDLLAHIPPERVSQTGTMPWYGMNRSVVDLINNFCAHTQEHCTQIKAFRERS